MTDGKLYIRPRSNKPYSETQTTERFTNILFSLIIIREIFSEFVWCNHKNFWWFYRHVLIFIGAYRDTKRLWCFIIPVYNVFNQYMKYVRVNRAYPRLQSRAFLRGAFAVAIRRLFLAGTSGEAKLHSDWRTNAVIFPGNSLDYCHKQFLKIRWKQQQLAGDISRGCNIFTSSVTWMESDISLVLCCGHRAKALEWRKLHFALQVIKRYFVSIIAMGRNRMIILTPSWDAGKSALY